MIKIQLASLLLLLSFAVHAQTEYYSLNSPDSNVHWKVKPQAETDTDSLQLFRSDYPLKDWVDAIVPGTVFSSYVAAGLEKDPNFGDNIYQVDKTKYDRSYWYRTEFSVPASFTQEKIWLHFQGINRRGEVFLNGHRLGLLDGFMHRGKFDITALINPAGRNVLAVLVQTPQHPMANFASPTYICSGGWDWIPYVPGLNSGITDKVFLSNSGPVTLEDPWIRTLLPTNARADLVIAVTAKNNSSAQQEVTLKGVIQPGSIEFTQKISIAPHRSAEIKLDKSDFPQLVIHNPLLWWPNGYGAPNLYTCQFRLCLGEKVSDTQTTTFGIKRYSYDNEGGVLHLSINGKRIFVKGANWGMPEYLLRCRGKEYDTKVRLHQEMHFNMIRNWLGSTTDDEFYEACDKYGLLVWDDFWLNSNPNLPEDIHCFNFNAIEKIKRVRNHPCIAVWCGNNEGWPEPPLDNWLKENIATFDANDRRYQSNSHEGDLSGSGLWGNHDPRWYFTAYPTSLGGTPGWGFRTEIGTAVFPNYESFRKFMPADKQWPRNEMWDKHFFGPWAFNATPDQYDAAIAERYGKPENIEEYCRKAQLLNIETNQAMYEGWLDHMWEDASGIITWMGQSAYPSMVWQTYDYYYDLTGAFWGARKACEPLHIQWNPLTNSVKVVNTTSRDQEHLTAEVAVYNSDGSEVETLRCRQKISAYSNTATHCFTIPFYKHVTDIAQNKPVVVSSTENGRPEDVTDRNEGTRWASQTGDNEWLYIDLQQPVNIYGVGLNWETAYGKEYKIQVSNDAQHWQDVYHVQSGKTGKQDLFFDDVKARYVKVQGIKRGTGWGYSLWEMKVYGGTPHVDGLSDVHFLKLRLSGQDGHTISENLYWRGIHRADFTALNRLPKVKLKVSSKSIRQGDKQLLMAKITNPASSPAVAFANWVQVRNSKTGERILPVIMSDNYFTLLKGETREIRIEFDAAFLKDGAQAILTVEPYNNAEIVK